MKKKIKKEKREAFVEAEEGRIADTTDLTPEESAKEFDEAEEDNRAKEKEEKKESAHGVLKPPRPLEKNQKYFEKPEGGLVPGPIESTSIPDPDNPDRELNPHRHPSKRLI